MQIAHTAYHDNETAANMFFYFALSTSNTEAEYAHWFVSTGPNTYHDDVAKIAALKQHFAATPHGNVTHDEMIFVQRLYEKAAYLTFYLDKTEDLCVHVKNMMKKSTESLSRSISICHIYDTRIKILTYFQILWDCGGIFRLALIPRKSVFRSLQRVSSLQAVVRVSQVFMLCVYTSLYYTYVHCEDIDRFNRLLQTK